jgi:predicted ArsR family transcriptional regulator
MTPADIRDMNWKQIEDSLTGVRQSVYNALAATGPCTTLQLADRSGISPFTVRPRVTELCELGLAECVGKDGREGLYRAVPMFAAWHNHEARRQPRQLDLL